MTLMVEIGNSLDFYKDIKVILQVQEMFQAERAVYMEVLWKEKLFKELKEDQSDKVWRKQRTEWDFRSRQELALKWLSHVTGSHSKLVFSSDCHDYI